MSRCRRLHRALWGVCAALACAAAPAATCVAEGATVAYTQSDTTDMMFLVSQPEGDYRFALLDAEHYQRLDSARPDDVLFQLGDGVHMFKIVDVSRFVDAGQRLHATAVLPHYAAWHARQAADNGAPYTRMQELARTRRAAYRSTPETYFLRWRLHAGPPEDVRGVYYLSTVTVSGQRVATIAALVNEPAELARAQAQLDRFATSFRLLEADELCPAPQGP